MQNLDVYNREGGKIWNRDPADHIGANGLIASITQNSNTTLGGPNRIIRFLQAAFDSFGERLIAADYLGHIYLFDFHYNRFSLLQSLGETCTAIGFGLHRQNEYIVALADSSVKCFDIERKDVITTLTGHESAVHHISVHGSGKYALTSSNDTSHLWDLISFQRKRKLNVKENVGILQVFFLPMSNTIVTCFKDDSIFGWEVDTLKCNFQLKVPDGTNPHFKTFAASRDGRMLIGGGRSRFLYVWAIDTYALQRIIELPAKVTVVKQLEFLPDSFDGGANQVLGVLAQDGIFRFFNISSCQQLYDLGDVDNQISKVFINPTGSYVSCLMQSGNINVYSVKTLAEIHHQVPPALTKIASVAENSIRESKSKSSKTSSHLKDTEKNSSKLASQMKVTLPKGLSMSRLSGILRGFGEYPAKYRIFIWRSILHLPENHVAYATLVDKGTHPSYEQLHEKYPLKSRKLLRVLQRCLSSLAHWSPLFGEVDYLPGLVFPFAKLFQNNQILCFEIVASLLVNWCQHWFEYFPNAPIGVLGMVENVLAYHDKELLQHIIELNVTTQIYVWPLLQTLFSEVLTSEEWLRLFDNVFSNHPSYLLLCVVAYYMINRGPLLHCSELDDFKFFTHHQNAVDINQLIKEAYRLMDSTPEDIHPINLLAQFEPLTVGQYPVFNKYPKFIVDYQIQERERIRQEELDYVQQRVAALDLQRETQRRIQEQEAWIRHQQLLVEAEQKQRDAVANEEKKLASQRTRLAAMNRELRAKELQLLGAVKQKFLVEQQQQREVDVLRLADDLKTKVERREAETKEAIENVEVRNMELEVKRKLLQQDLEQKRLENERRQQMEENYRRLQENRCRIDSQKREMNNSNRPHATVLTTENSRFHNTENDSQHYHFISSDGDNRVRFRTNDAEHPRTPNKALNDSSSTEQSTQISLDRGRHTFEERERQLMAEVRGLRRQLASDNRRQHPPPEYTLY